MVPDDPSPASDRQRVRRRPDFVPDDPLLTASEAALVRSQGLSTFWRDVRAKRVPAPYYVTPRCPRWRLSELEAGIVACRGS
jgi:predicted DNA-binding transcriptional regulator AlpA